MGEVHLIEPGGAGGVYQHAVELATQISQDGRVVVLHTADQVEFRPPAAVQLCPCCRWFRRVPYTKGRQALIAASFLMRTIPHVCHAAHRRPLHVQGQYKPWLMCVMAAIAKLTVQRLVFSPHNSFSRRGSKLDYEGLRMLCRLSDVVVAFNDKEAQVLEPWSRAVVTYPLIQAIPERLQTSAQEIRQRLGVERGVKLILGIGQIRRDKGFDLLIQALEKLDPDRYQLALVGEDKGGRQALEELAGDLRVAVAWDIRYLELAELCSYISASDLVALPYVRGSQSGVLSLARALETKTIASRNLGDSHKATRAVDCSNVEAFAVAIREVAELESHQYTAEAPTIRFDIYND